MHCSQLSQLETENFQTSTHFHKGSSSTFVSGSHYYHTYLPITTDTLAPETIQWQLHNSNISINSLTTYEIKQCNDS